MDRSNELLSAERITADGNGPSVDIHAYEGEAVFVLSASATENADNTYDVALEQSDDDATWAAVTEVSFEQVDNAAGSFQVARANVDGLSQYVRATDTLGGSTPAVTRSLTVTGQTKY